MAKKNNNLDNKGFDKLTAKEQRKIASMGGKASAEARRKKRDLRLALEVLLESNVKKKNLSDKEQDMSVAEAMALEQVKKALEGDSKAFEIVRDSSGQKPVEKIQVAEVDADVISEVERMVMDESE